MVPIITPPSSGTHNEKARPTLNVMNKKVQRVADLSDVKNDVDDITELLVEQLIDEVEEGNTKRPPLHFVEKQNYSVWVGLGWSLTVAGRSLLIIVWKGGEMLYIDAILLHA